MAQKTEADNPMRDNQYKVDSFIGGNKHRKPPKEVLTPENVCLQKKKKKKTQEYQSSGVKKLLVPSSQESPVPTSHTRLPGRKDPKSQRHFSLSRH